MRQAPTGIGGMGHMLGIDLMPFVVAWPILRGLRGNAGH